MTYKSGTNLSKIFIARPMLHNADMFVSKTVVVDVMKFS